MGSIDDRGGGGDDRAGGSAWAAWAVPGGGRDCCLPCRGGVLGCYRLAADCDAVRPAVADDALTGGAAQSSCGTAAGGRAGGGVGGGERAGSRPR